MNNKSNSNKSSKLNLPVMLSIILMIASFAVGILVVTTNFSSGDIEGFCSHSEVDATTCHLALSAEEAARESSRNIGAIGSFGFSAVFLMFAVTLASDRKK